MTRRHVTVALSGDGGDELFTGYNRYFWAEALWRRLGRVPAPLRSAGAAALRALSPTQWNCVFNLVPERMRPPQPGDKLHKLAGMLGRDGPDAVYRRLVSFWEPDSVLIEGKEPAGVLWDDSIARDIPSFAGAHAVHGHGDLPARRHPDQGRPRDDGGQPRGARAAARPPRRRACVDACR